MTTLEKLPVWHAGEIALQQRVGVAEKMAEAGSRIFRDFMPDQHRDFYAKIPFIVVGSVDAHGDVWATLLTGGEGFITSPTATSLHIRSPRDPGDPAVAGMGEGAAIGLLGIELHTRRRNRVNGIVRGAGPGLLRFQVDQSFGNCPQYIQLRDYAFARDPAVPVSAPSRESDGIDDQARAMIEAADTCFVATYTERPGRRQIDASHRGGRPGFVRVGADGILTIPDFAGNQFFNTLGNILVNGKAGLVFVDFTTGDMLHVTGDADLILDGPEIAAFQGAERLWRLRPRRVVHRAGAMALRWSLRQGGWSPNSLLTGDWEQAAARLRAAELANSWRPFTVARIVDESRNIRSFHLAPADGAGLLAHQAGQHLPIRLTLPDADRPVIRTYTLSVAPSDGYYRISVKRDGRVSRHLYDHVQPGDVIEARAPAGAFTIDAGQEHPAILMAAGIGVTPLLAMLRHVVYEGVRTRGVRPTILIYAAHSKADRAFDGELAALVQQAQGAVRVVRVLSDVSDAVRGRDYDIAGHIEPALFARDPSLADCDFYLCGPPGFTQAQYDGLRGLGVADDHIHAEAFGPSSLVRSVPVAAYPAPATGLVPVTFALSIRQAQWSPGAGSLLDLAEAQGLNPEFSCRSGTCGTCRTRVLSGAVTYTRPPTAPHGPDEALICCAVPTEGVQLAL